LIREGPSRDGVVILGAGPAGLSAAYELARYGKHSVVLEQDSVAGGLARTSEYKGYLFDIGGHRFFTKVRLVEKMWKDVLGDDLLERPRLSRIYYRSKFFHYPLDPMNVIAGLGFLEVIRCGISFLAARAFPQKPEIDFETWISNRFGKRLFRTFFENYTEKVWGIPCREIGAEWAAQRIRGLSLATLVHSAFHRRRPGKAKIRTLAQQFYYPRRGPGMMWTRVKELVESAGSEVVFNAPAERIHWKPGRVTGVSAGGRFYPGEHFVSSIPIRELMARLDPPPPPRYLEAAERLQYRDFLTVALIVKQRDLFPDNWIYVHDPSVAVGRIQNYKNWSPEMTPDSETSCLGMEYFCFKDDHLWRMADADLIELARREVAQLGLARAEDAIDGCVVRMPKAYPVYDKDYRAALSLIREFLDTLPNLQLAGRNGMHRYNNQDHSMLTAIMGARNILGAHNDLWKLDADSSYQEHGEPITDEELVALGATQPLVPSHLQGGTVSAGSSKFSSLP